MSENGLNGPMIARPQRPRRVDRRNLLQLAAGLLTAGVAAKLVWEYEEALERSAVFVAAVPSYDEAALQASIRRALLELGVNRQSVRGKSVLLKPNLVEPSPHMRHANTDPAVVLAAAEVFRGMDAAEVFVAEGQANCRDARWLLEESGFGRDLEPSRLRFVDLNYDDIEVVENRLGASALRDLCLPRSIRRADIIVSMPKMKTHRWTGVTLSMKNLFGLMPGICYGWPKNPLHYAGIHPVILDIVAAARPHLALVDGIVGMEGNGPLMGTPAHSGVMIAGRNLPAVDSTAARLMGITPRYVPHLSLASGLLGPIRESHIEQRGENVDPLIHRYKPAQ